MSYDKFQEMIKALSTVRIQIDQTNFYDLDLVEFVRTKESISQELKDHTAYYVQLGAVSANVGKAVMDTERLCNRIKGSLFLAAKEKEATDKTAENLAIIHQEYHNLYAQLSELKRLKDVLKYAMDAMDSKKDILVQLNVNERKEQALDQVISKIGE